MLTGRQKYAVPKIPERPDPKHDRLADLAKQKHIKVVEEADYSGPVYVEFPGWVPGAIVESIVALRKDAKTHTLPLPTYVAAVTRRRIDVDIETAVLTHLVDEGWPEDALGQMRERLQSLQTQWARMDEEDPILISNPDFSTLIRLK